MNAHRESPPAAMRVATYNIKHGRGMDGAIDLERTAATLATLDADLIALQLDRPAARGVPPLEAAVFNANPDWVEDVWGGGQRIATEGRHPEREAIVRAASEWLPTG